MGEYERPILREIGSLRDLTRQQFNKVGSTADVHSTVINQVVGSLVPVS
jgi:hypothetical protein